MTCIVPFVVRETHAPSHDGVFLCRSLQALGSVSQLLSNAPFMFYLWMETVKLDDRAMNEIAMSERKFESCMGDAGHVVSQGNPEEEGDMPRNYVAWDAISDDTNWQAEIERMPSDVRQFVQKDKTIESVMKAAFTLGYNRGLDAGSGRRMSEIIKDIVGDVSNENNEEPATEGVNE